MQGVGKKLLFLSLSLAVVLLSVGLVRGIFLSSDSAGNISTHHQVSGTMTDDFSSEEMQARKKGSVWSRIQLLKTPPSDLKSGLKQEAQVQNNLENLLALYDGRQDKELLERLKQLIETHPQIPEYRALLGDYHYNEGNWLEAESAVRSLLEIDPKNEFARVTLGELTAIQGKFLESESILENIMETHPGNSSALYGYVSLMEMQGREKEGFDRILKIYNTNPNDGNIAVVLADLYYSKRNLEKRKSILEQATQLDPQNPEPWRALATDAVRQAEYARAYGLAATSLQYDKNPVTQIRSLDIMYQAALGQGKFVEAESALQKIIQINPNDFAAHQQIKQVRQMAENAKK